MTDIYTKFIETAESRKMISPGDRILLSLSAGKDSMAMLDLMLRRRETAPFDLGIFHLNHLTRGEDSDNDEALVKKRAAETGLPFYGRKFDFNKDRKHGISFEEHAREVRYGMLNEICSSEGFNKIATAHNSRDNTETVLMRIFSGTGIFGLRGITHTNGIIIRPLLDISPDDIYSYNREKKIEWREDRTNSENEYRRNYIRNVVLPTIKVTFPDAEDNINRLSEHAEENEELLSFMTERINPGWLRKTPSGHSISIETFKDNIAFIKYMISRCLMSEYGIRLNISIINEIIRRYSTNRSNIVLYEKGDIMISKLLLHGKTVIEITDSTVKKPVPDIWEYDLQIRDQFSAFIPEIKRYINYRKSRYEEFCRLKKDTGFIFIKIPSGMNSMKLRNRRDGDRIILECGPKKIKELMIEKKLDINTKKSVPLLLIDNEIAAYLPGAAEIYPDRVSCNFWVDGCTDSMFVFYFTESPDFNII